MAKIRIMLSSRCNSKVEFPGNPSLSELRRKLKKQLEEMFPVKRFIEVWINEEGASAAGDHDSVQHCLEQVDKADIVIALYNGEAGWSAEVGDIGICHLELSRAIQMNPHRLRIIRLPLANEGKGVERNRNRSFRSYVDDMNRFHGKTPTSEGELIDCVKSAVFHALGDAVHLGNQNARVGRGYNRAALSWAMQPNELLKKNIEKAILEYLLAKENAEALKGIENAVVVPVTDANRVIFSVSASPQGDIVILGQPHRRDGKFKSYYVKGDGPVHIVGCFKTMTESKARNVLGSGADARIYKFSTGIWAVDDLLGIQVVFLNKCNDTESTKFAVSEFFKWLNGSSQNLEMFQRAKVRNEIAAAMLFQDAGKMKAVS